MIYHLGLGLYTFGLQAATGCCPDKPAVSASDIE
jgi:hypothetical protein